MFVIFQFSVRGSMITATLYAIHLNVTPIELGLVISSAALFPMIFGVHAGRVSDRIGFRIPLIVGPLVASLALILPFLFRENLFVLMISQSIFGFAHMLLLVSMQNLIGTLSEEESRSNNFSLLSLGISAANLVSPSLTGLSIDFLNFSSTYLLLSFCALIPGLVHIIKNFFSVRNAAVEHFSVQSGFVDLLTSSQLRNILIVSAVILTGIGIFEFYLPVFGSQIGLTASMIGLILSVHSSAYFVVRIFMPFLVKIFKEEKLLKFCLWISAVVFMLIPYSKNIILLVFISFVLGLSLGCCQPLSIALAYNRSPYGRTGEVLGLRLTINKIVQFFLPIGFGSMVSLLGFITIFWSNALLFMMSGFLKYEKVDNMQSITIKKEDF